MMRPIGFVRELKNYRRDLIVAAQICKTCKNKDKMCYCAPNSTCSDYEEANVKHTVFDKFRQMSIDELTDYIDKYGAFDNAPWSWWFDEIYCQNCPDIMCKYGSSNREFPCSYCELNGKCKFFPEYGEAPSNKEIIKMWLESESEDN